MRYNIRNRNIASEQKRFVNLLELANRSKYRGERENALAAASRLANKFGMTLDQAAKLGLNYTQGVNGDNKNTPDSFYENISKEEIRKNQVDIESDKKRWQTAVENAKKRGLDQENKIRKNTKKTSNFRRTNNTSRREPFIHAMILLKETSLSFKEIANITGISVYKVIALKLKTRKAA